MVLARFWENINENITFRRNKQWSKSILLKMEIVHFA